MMYQKNNCDLIFDRTIVSLQKDINGRAMKLLNWDISDGLLLFV